MRTPIAVGMVALVLGSGMARGEEPIAEGVRGLATRAKTPIAMDGSLAEWGGAFCTPVHYNHGDLANRAAQFFYQWDDAALYIGLRALDERRADPGPPAALWNGDAVEFYLDTRPGEALRGKDWSEGAIHLFFTAFEGDRIGPRWAMRQGIATSATDLEGVEVAATESGWGYEVEFKLPWANFPRFRPAMGALIGIDAELCSGDGAGRTDRTFAFGSPLSVQQPASLGAVQLVDTIDVGNLPMAVGASAFPLWVETPWNQPSRAVVRAVVGIAPGLLDEVEMVEVRLHDPDGRVVETLPAAREPFGPQGKGFERAVATWSIDEHAPGTYFATARIAGKGGKALATVAPRMVQEAQMSGR